MRFQVTSDGIKKEYETFLEAAKDLGVETRVIHRFLKNNIGGGKFQRRKDKKIFFIERIDKICQPLIKIDGQEFFNIPQVLEKYNLRQKNFISQMAKNHFGFLDSEKNPHHVDWVNETLADVFKTSKFKKDNEDSIKLKQTLVGWKEPRR